MRKAGNKYSSCQSFTELNPYASSHSESTIYTQFQYEKIKWQLLVLFASLTHFAQARTAIAQNSGIAIFAQKLPGGVAFHQWPAQIAAV